MLVNKIKQEVLNGFIPSAVTNSSITLNIGTKKDKAKHAFIPTGQQSSKVFQLPKGTLTPASKICHLQHGIRQPVKDFHIVPDIDTNSLISTAHFAQAEYITIFDGKKVNIYDAYNTKIVVTKQAILRGWFDKDANLWQIPLVPIVLNNNTDTVLVSKPPTEFLYNHPPPTKTIHNIYKLKTQPELIQYLHAVAGFPTRPTGVAAVKNKQLASWPGLTMTAIAKNFPASKETIKGHGRKGRSGLPSTKQKEPTSNPTCNPITEPNNNKDLTIPIAKKHNIFIKVYLVEEETNKTVYTDQPGLFQKNEQRQSIHHSTVSPQQQYNPTRGNEKPNIQ